MADHNIDDPRRGDKDGDPMIAIPQVEAAEGYGLLRCPCCDSEWLHHDKVVTFSRKEDADDTIVSMVTFEGVASQLSVPSDISTNPSSRRHGVSIFFRCEECCNDSTNPQLELTIAQHKGFTKMVWRRHGQ